MARNPRIGELRQKSDFDSLFWDDEASHPLRLLLIHKDSTMKRRHVEKQCLKHIDMLKTTKESEKEFFWQEASASNLLAFLYLMTDEDKLALEQLNLTLQHSLHNLNAMVGMIRISEQQFHDSEAKEKIKQLKKLKEDSKEMEKQKYICQGEIAYACSFIGPEFYEQAVDRYEALLDDNSKLWTMKDELSGYIVRWRYYLAYTYNRMLNKGNKQKLAEKLGTEDMGAIFDKISKLYDRVIGSGDMLYTGKAMIDLVDTHKKCETSGHYQVIQFPYSCGPDQYVELAMKEAPSDPHVLERCGRHYRQRARNKKDFEETVAIFDKLLELHPARHVAWHHKGLACRALWHIVGKYDEARLYNNRARTGEKKQFRKQNRVQRQTPHIDGASAAAAECQNYSSVSVPHRTAFTPSSVQSQSTAVDEPAADRPTQDSPSNLRETPRTAPRKLPTLRPYNRRQIKDVPMQMKKPDYFDKLRTSNPSVKDNGSRKFLEQAKNCFKEAKEITKGTCSPYIVDLARSLVSLGLYDKAESEFNATNKLAGTMNNNDATYLYEQWALLRHCRAEQAETNSGRMKDVARLYRQAILSAVRARDRSRMAFYKLRDLLRDELHRDPDNEALQMEYSVLCNTVEKYSECRNIHMLVEALKEDEETRIVAWEMITLLHGRRHLHDAATVFMYLTALHEADQLDLKDSATASDSHESNKELLLDVVRQLVCDGDQTSADRGQTFGEIFRWMVGARHVSDYITLDKNSPKVFAESGEICILAPSGAMSEVSTVMRVLQHVCGIVVVKAFCEGNDDVPLGCSILEGLRAVVAISQAVVVVENSADTENWKCMFPVLDELMTLRDVRMCFVAGENADCSNTEQRYVQRWPRVTITGEDTDVQLAYKLLKAMFCESDK